MELTALSHPKEKGGSIPEGRARHILWPLLVFSEQCIVSWSKRSIPSAL
jgi:hypothetical protein